MRGTGVGGDADGDTLTGIEQVLGSNHNDLLIGDGGANQLWGMGGDDTLRGGAGADVLKGGDGIDTADYSTSETAVKVSLTSLSGTAGDAQGDGWSRYNFSGYEGRPQYPEYYDVVQTMAEIGKTNGCGRVEWENNEDNGLYGTTMSLMLLPHWTDGCIASMEGLFFEASGTTPYHFLTASAVSQHSSNPVRRLDYGDGQVDKGVEYLQTLGVRYYLAFSDAIIAKADKNPNLTPVAMRPDHLVTGGSRAHGSSPWFPGPSRSSMLPRRRATWMAPNAILVALPGRGPCGPPLGSCPDQAGGTTFRSAGGMHTAGSRPASAHRGHWR